MLVAVADHQVIPREIVEWLLGVRDMAAVVFQWFDERQLFHGIPEEQKMRLMGGAFVV